MVDVRAKKAALLFLTCEQPCHDTLHPRRDESKRAPDPARWLTPPPPPSLPDGNGRRASDRRRQLSSQLTGCCTAYMTYSAKDMCALYREDCASGLSFIGVSFSVNTALGNPYLYQLCDQFPMENIIKRNHTNVMSMDEDGWLVGGGYKSFDHSGKMP